MRCLSRRLETIEHDGNASIEMDKAPGEFEDDQGILRPQESKLKEVKMQTSETDMEK